MGREQREASGWCGDDGMDWTVEGLGTSQQRVATVKQAWKWMVDCVGVRRSISWHTRGGGRGRRISRAAGTPSVAGPLHRLLAVWAAGCSVFGFGL